MIFFYFRKWIYILKKLLKYISKLFYSFPIYLKLEVKIIYVVQINSTNVQTVLRNITRVRGRCFLSSFTFYCVNPSCVNIDSIDKRNKYINTKLIFFFMRWSLRCLYVILFFCKKRASMFPWLLDIRKLTSYLGNVFGLRRVWLWSRHFLLNWRILHYFRIF